MHFHRPVEDAKNTAKCEEEVPYFFIFRVHFSTFLYDSLWYCHIVYVFHEVFNQLSFLYKIPFSYILTFIKLKAGAYSNNVIT